MNWQTAGLLLVLFTLAGLVHLRTLTRRRRLFLVLWLFIGVLVYRWANYRGAWSEIGVGAGGAAVLLLIWWLVHGRHLDPPSDENIRVWSEEDPFE